MKFDIELLAQSAAFLLPVIQANPVGALILLGFGVCACVMVWLLRK